MMPVKGSLLSTQTTQPEEVKEREGLSMIEIKRP
jgi:hypothetical protein